VSRCRHRRNPTKAAIVPRRRILIVHLDVKAVLIPAITVVSQLVRTGTTPRSTTESHRSKPAPSAL